MKIIYKLSIGIVAALLCLGVNNVQAQNTYRFTAITCGNWNNGGIHGSTTLYQIGYSFQRPSEQIAYFEFDLTPAQGKTVTGASIFIPGSTDYSINSYWANPDNGFSTHIQFKVGIAPQSGAAHPLTLSEILTGNNDYSVYLNAADANRNPDLDYRWFPEGFHFGATIDAFHYEFTGQVPPSIQNAVNAGGDYILWAIDRVDSDINGQQLPQNYIWGSTSYNTNIVLSITTSN